MKKVNSKILHKGTTLVSGNTSGSEMEQAPSLAPNEGKLPHRHLFPTGKLGFKVIRENPLPPSKYFNQRLLNFSQK